jgi:hypothetical protein
MQIVIGSVLSAADLDSLRVALDGAHFVDGRETAGFAARTVKHNLQAASEPALEAIRTMVRERILANEVFALAVRPKALSLMFSRYDPGMRYGAHVDDAIMHGMRADVAFTLFVSDQQSYDGGELVLDTAAGEDAIKLAARRLSGDQPASRRRGDARDAACRRRLGAQLRPRSGAARVVVRSRYRAPQAVRATGLDRGIRPAVEIARQPDADVG